MEPQNKPESERTFCNFGGVCFIRGEKNGLFSLLLGLTMTDQLVFNYL